MQRYIITEDQADAVLHYLAGKEYHEVHQLIAMIQTQLPKFDTQVDAAPDPDLPAKTVTASLPDEARTPDQSGSPVVSLLPTTPDQAAAASQATVDQTAPTLSQISQ